VLSSLNLRGKTAKPKFLAWDGKSIWCANNDRPVISAVDPSSGEIVRTLDFPDAGRCRGFSFGGGYFWVALHYGRVTRLTKMDPADGSRHGFYRFGFPLCFGVAYVDGALWVRQGNRMVKTDAGTGKRLLSFRRRPGVDYYAFAGYDADSMFMFNPGERRVLLVRMPSEPKDPTRPR
jgi:hypothetical protein